MELYTNKFSELFMVASLNNHTVLIMSRSHVTLHISRDPWAQIWFFKRREHLCSRHIAYVQWLDGTCTLLHTKLIASWASSQPVAILQAVRSSTACSSNSLAADLFLSSRSISEFWKKKKKNALLYCSHALTVNNNKKKCDLVCKNIVSNRSKIYVD